MILEKYFNRIRHLRMAKPYLDDINKLFNLLDNYNHRQAIVTVSKLTTKYEDGINKIGFLMSGRPVVKGQINTLYAEHTEDDMVADIEYIIDCIIIIAAVRFGVVKSYETAINELLNYDYD